jgi:hypothetical protein
MPIKLPSNDGLPKIFFFLFIFVSSLGPRPTLANLLPEVKGNTSRSFPYWNVHCPRLEFPHYTVLSAAFVLHGVK